MKKEYVVLSLDPMYSPLHEKIARLVAKEKYAVTSCLSKKVYLPTFPIHLAAALIGKISAAQAQPFYDKIRELKTYHHAFAKKREHRELSEQEVAYMARFYVAIKAFIVEKQVDLVLVNNDTRWHHAISIEVCRELGIRYLVTEQGLIRPHTTVIDPKGVNAYADIRFGNADEVKGWIGEYPSFRPCDKHDSIRSMFFFLLFLIGFAAERWAGSKTVLRYLHNNYSLRKYGKRMVNRFKPRKKQCSTLAGNAALLLLQLEYDSQVLVHSSFESNQEVIALIEEITQRQGMKLAIKAHPLDTAHYALSPSSYWVDGKVPELAEQAKVVFTINSSAAIDVLRTNTPLILMGDSIYEHRGIASRLNWAAGADCIANAASNTDANERCRFIDYLSHQYLLLGAGYSYSPEVLRDKLKTILQ
ncbi:phosphoribosylamine--glycine ligase [Vibrio rotiferianus]|uniref:capsular polysaccharide export protein, LipB/KpsS family n=1 Tax=Vibrio rotiferianus TaxID=190895 RepID=UPI00406A270B